MVGEFEARLQARVLEWSRHLPEFEPSHATFGAFLAPRYLGERFAADEERGFLMGLSISFWYWLDDRSDGHLESPVVDWEELVATAQRRLEPSKPHKPEVTFLLDLGGLLEQHAPERADAQWWWETAAMSLRAFAREEEISRSGRPPSYAEYLAVAAKSITVENLASSASLLAGMALAGRGADPLLEQGMRYLCTVARLENDLHSYQRDRREGCLANAVLVMERFMPPAQAVTFITAELEAYRALLERVLTELGPADSFVRLARRALESHKAYYEISRSRYSATGA